MTSRDGGREPRPGDGRAGGQAAAPGARRPAAAVHGARGPRPDRAHQRRPAQLHPHHASRSATASRWPSSCGSTAGAAPSTWPRRATSSGASCACSTRWRRRPPSSGSASRARCTRWGASTSPAAWPAPTSREVGRAAIDLYGGNLRVTREQLTSSRLGGLAPGHGGAGEPRGGADPHPGGRTDRGRQVEPHQHAGRRRGSGRSIPCRPPGRSPPTS